jgi:predicted FMN-binding regulatory protein PaiB
MKVENLQYKKKLSQNRSKEDRLGVIKGPESRGDDQSHLVLDEIKKVMSTQSEMSATS